MSEPFDAHLLLEHAEFLRGLARSLVGDAALADDVVQETFAVALQRPPAPGNLRAWLATVARSIAFGERRAAGRRQRREQAVARAEPQDSIAETTARLDLQTRLVHAVGALEEPLRSTVVGRFYDQLSFEEIAAREGVSVRTISRRLDAALERLRGRLDAAHGGNRSGWTTLLLPLCGKRRRAVAGVAAITALGGLRRFAAIFMLCVAVCLTAVSAWLALRGGGSTRFTASTMTSSREDADPTTLAEVAAPARLHVKVLRWEDRDPLPGIPVSVVRGDAVQETVETDEYGMAALSMGVPGDAVRVAAEGFVPVERDVTSASGTIEVELEAGLPLRGRVVAAESGEVPARVHMWITQKHRPREGIFLNADTSRFATIVPANRPLHVSAAAPGYYTVSATVRRMPAGVVDVFDSDRRPHGSLKVLGEDEIEIVVGAGFTVSGAVVTESGHPTRRSEVRFLASDGSDSLSPAGGSYIALIDGEGKFVMQGLPPGDFDIVARSGSEGVRTRVTVGTGAPPVPLQLRLSSRPCLRIQALDEQGRPLDHWARATAESPFHTIEHGSHPKHGEPTLILLSRSGLYRVEMYGDGWGRAVEVDVTQTGYRDMVVRVGEGALNGLVTDEAGNPIPEVDVSFSGTTHETDIATTGVSLAPPSCDALTDADGRFTIRGIEACKGELVAASVDRADEEVVASDWMEERIADVVTGGEPVHLRLRRAPCVRLRLKPSVARLRWCVDARNCEPPPIYKAVRSPDGAFRLPIRGRGITTLTIMVAGYLDFEVALAALKEGETLELGEFGLEPGFEVEGVVRSGGKPVPGASIEFSDGVDFEEEQTDPNGEFRLKAVMGSQGAITIRGRGILDVCDLPVKLSPGARLTFDLEEAGRIKVALADAEGQTVSESTGRLVAVPFDEKHVESREKAILLDRVYPWKHTAVPLGRYQLYYSGPDGVEHRGPSIAVEHVAQFVEVRFTLPK